MSYVPCRCLPQEASLILVKQQTEQNILNCYIYLNGNENSQNIPLIGEAGVVEVERLQSQQIKIIHGKCMLRCRTIPLIGEALLGMLEMELKDQMPSLMQEMEMNILLEVEPIIFRVRS